MQVPPSEGRCYCKLEWRVQQYLCKYHLKQHSEVAGNIARLADNEDHNPASICGNVADLSNIKINVKLIAYSAHAMR